MNDEARVRANAKPESTQKQKKPYVKPSFRCEQVFETMAVACGKNNATEVQCTGLGAKFS